MTDLKTYTEAAKNKTPPFEEVKSTAVESANHPQPEYGRWKGYQQLLLARLKELWREPERFADSWNFGPPAQDCRPVRWIIEKVNEFTTEPVVWRVDPDFKPHEAGLLTLDSAKARSALGWGSRWSVETALRSAIDWYNAYGRSEPPRSAVLRDIERYEATSISS